MAPVARRTAPAPAPPVAGPNFGEDTFYAAGGGFPEGDYCVFHDVKLYTPTKKDGTVAGPEFLAVVISAYDMNDPAYPNVEPKEKALSMGRNTHLSFLPSPDGKSLVPVPGGPGGSTMNDSTNWNIYRRSMYDCGLPSGVFTDNVGALDGIHVHIQNVPEPDSRKEMRARKQSTGDVEEQQRGPQTVPVVTEIKEDGKPWEGTGGLPEAAPVKATAKPGPKAVARPGAKAAPVAAAVDTDDEAVQVAAINGISAVLEKKPAGCVKLILKGETFKAISATEGAEMATKVIDTFFNDDATLNELLGQMGYALTGQQVKPAA